MDMDVAGGECGCKMGRMWRKLDGVKAIVCVALIGLGSCGASSRELSVELSRAKGLGEIASIAHRLVVGGDERLEGEAILSRYCDENRDVAYDAQFRMLLLYNESDGRVWKEWFSESSNGEDSFQGLGVAVESAMPERVRGKLLINGGIERSEFANFERVDYEGKSAYLVSVGEASAHAIWVSAHRVSALIEIDIEELKRVRGEGGVRAPR